MGVVSAIVAAVAKITIGAVVKFVAGTILSIGVSRLMAKRAMKKANAGGDGGARIQLPPATDNKLPVVYGSAFVSGPITDAKLSTDQKTMWYVVALAEHCDDQGGGGGSYTFDTNNIYYDGKKVNFVGSTASVLNLEVNNQGSTKQFDTRVNGKLFIYLFTNGSSNGVNTGGLTAIQILQDSQIPAGQRWTANHLMTNTCFAIVKVIYNTDAGTTNLGALACKITNSLTKPGECLKDYMLNTRYGCAIPLARIDTDSLDDLDTYSDQTITYIPVGGGSATQARYRINGPLDTASDCLTNLQVLVDACDSWLQYSELEGKWSVVINKPYDTAPNAETLNDLFLVDSSNLVGGITLNPIDLNETYNEVEVAYPNKNIKDQTDFQVLELEDYQAGLLSPNEAINRLNVQLPVVNEAVQAKYLAVRRLLQSREDLVIVFRTDYSGIQVLAGDVIRVDHPVYGWGPLPDNPSNPSKLFRVSNVSEEKYSDGTLGAQLVAFEYNDTIYADNAIQDYVPAFNTGLTDPNIISEPGTPNVALNNDTTALITSFNVESWVPDEGTVLYMDFNYGNSSNVEQHERLRTVQAAGGIPFTNSDSNSANYNYLSIDINDLPAGNYFFSCTARNDFAGRVSNSTAAPFNWQGANVNSYDPNTGNGGIIGNQIQPNTITGNNIAGNTITGNNIANYTIDGNNIANFTIVGNNIANFTIVGNNIANNTLTGNNIANNTITGNNIANNTIVGNNIANFTITSNNLSNTGVVAGCYTSANICVDDAGRITFAANGSGGNAAGVIGNDLKYAGGGAPANVWAQSGLIPFPVNLVGGRQFQISNIAPFTGIMGNTWTPNLPNDYNPWYYGTSNTADQFAVNGTGTFQPQKAALQEIGIPNSSPYFTWGHAGWVPVAVTNISANSIPSMTATIEFVSPTTQTIQMAGYAVWNYSNSTVYGSYVDYGSVKNINLVANVSHSETMTFVLKTENRPFVGGNATPVLEPSVMGVVVRNPNSGSDCYIPASYRVFLQ